MSATITAKGARMQLEDLWFCYQTLLDLSQMEPPVLPQPASRTKRTDGEDDHTQENVQTKEDAASTKKKGASATLHGDTKEESKVRSKPATTTTTPATTKTTTNATPPVHKRRNSEKSMELFKMKIQSILLNMAALTESIAHVQTQNETLEENIRQELQQGRAHKKGQQQQQEEEKRDGVSAGDLDDAYKRRVEKVRQMDKKNDLLRNEIEALEGEIRQKERLLLIKQKNRRSPGTTAADGAATGAPPAAVKPGKAVLQKGAAGALGPQSSFQAWMRWVAARREGFKSLAWKARVMSLQRAVQGTDGAEGKAALEPLSEEEAEERAPALDQLSQEAIACVLSIKKGMQEQNELILEVQKAAARQRGRLKAISHVSDRK